MKTRTTSWMFRQSMMLAALCVATLAYGQQIRPLPSSRIYGELQKLKSLTSVLYVAAHPDDENTRLLAWLARGRHIRTAYLSLTRGDGGQNILGSEQGAALGLIRTHELLAARELDGAEQYFTRAVDFGYSKNPEETLRQWDKLVLIADVVRVIREMRPDVVITRFPKDSMAGHGQHSASAIITEAAVQYCYGTLNYPKAQLDAIDSMVNIAPSLTGPELWKPKRLVFNAFRFGNRSTITKGMFKLDVGHYDPLLGMGYGELAGISRSLHRSQGAGTPSTPGKQPEYFSSIIGDSIQRSLFDGIDTTWNRIGRQDIGNAIDSILYHFDMHAPERSLDRLLHLRDRMRSLADPFWTLQKSNELEKIILSCIGLTADLSMSRSTVAPGDTGRVALRFTTRAGRPIEVGKIYLPGGAYISGFTAHHDSLYAIDERISIPLDAAITEPYWLSSEPKGSMFSISSEQLLGQPVSAPVLTADITFSIAGELFVVPMPISYKHLDPLKGDVVEELRVVPPVSVRPLRSIVVAQNGRPRIEVGIRANTNIVNGTLLLTLGGAEIMRVPSISMRAQTDTIIVVQPAIATTSVVDISLVVSDRPFSRTVSSISYDHLPTLQYREPARVRVVSDPIAITARRIGFIAGAGEQTPAFLRGLGVTVDELDDAALQHPQDLLSYDALLVGIRALNTRQSMKYILPSLLQYVEQGGTLVMQYNTLQDLSTTQVAPYPLTISQQRVTEENASVEILNPKHSIFNLPNRITQKDFTGWVQERSVYNASKYDAAFEELLSMHDTGDVPQRGTLLYAKHGKGQYVFCALSLFRQIPAGVPGGMKLLANMLSLGSVKR